MAGVADQPAARATRRINTRGLSLRAFAARGVIINTIFDAGLSGLGLVRGFLLAVFLTRADYGVWGVLVVSIGVLARLKVVGVSDKYIQQEEPDQELAFQKAFTLEVLMTAAAMVPIAAALPAIALIYGHWQLVPPGAVLLLTLAAGALQAPFWVFYREMDFVRQRTLGSVEPIVGFVVAVGLAAAGAGYWALALGVVIGAWSGAIVAILKSPYRLRWRYDRGSLRVYASFSGPIFVATLCSVILANGAIIVANVHLGLAGVGVIALAGNITAFTNRVDDLVGGTLYPAICAIQDRLDLLRESFVKTNRLALMWAVPFGAGLALFSGDLVHYALGRKWEPAIGLLRITGVVAAVGHIGWNWDDYLRARGNTRPLAVAAVAATATFMAVGVPLTLALGLRGFAIGVAAQAAVALVCRAWYLARLFEGFVFVRHAARAILPALPAVVLVLLVRALDPSARTAATAGFEFGLYAVTTVVATWAMDGRLIREAVGYVRERRAPTSPALHVAQ